MCAEANFDLLELNLSCPHGMTEKGINIKQIFYYLILIFN